MPSRNIEVQAAYCYENYRWGDTVICRFRSDDGGPLTVKTKAEEEELVAGLTYTLFGRWTNHEKYGKQFHARSFVLTTPRDAKGIKAYLSRAGVTPSVVRKLWELYGPDAVRKLREETEVVVEEVDSRYLRVDKAEEVAIKLRSEKQTEDSQIDLTGLLAGRGMPRALIKQVIQRLGSAAAKLVRKNPYLLMGFPGVGFGKADALYLELGKPPGALKRQTLCLAYAMVSDGNGHTWFDTDFAEKAVRDRISGTAARPVEAAILGLRAKLFAIRRVDGAHPWLTVSPRANVEHDVADDAVALLQIPPAWPGVDDLDVSPHQREQLSLALQGRVGLLLGSPGTGKTYVAARLIAAISKALGPKAVAVTAPTGKAAVRVTEALAEYGLDQRAKTIHSYLGVQAVAGGTWSFTHGDDDPLEEDYIIVDEASMVDVSLLASLIRALSPSAHLLLVGDPNQLSPVGHGAPLRDLITAGVPMGELREIRRNAGQIVEVCGAIRDQQDFELSKRLDLDAGRNLILRETDSGMQSVGAILDMVSHIRDTKLADPLWQTQVIVAVNERSALSRKELNQLLRKALNEQNEDSTKYWPGDKIVCLKNGIWPQAPEDAGLDPEAEEFRVESDTQEVSYYVANGEIGNVVKEYPKKLILEFFNPVRTVLIPKGEDSGSLPFDLGYAISCHKSQGSEWKVVIVALDDYGGAKLVCDRSWLYTAISRAKQACILVGSEAVMRQMVRQQKISHRKTFLVERVAEARERYETRHSTQNGQAGREAAYDCAVTPTDSTATSIDG